MYMYDLTDERINKKENKTHALLLVSHVKKLVIVILYKKKAFVINLIMSIGMCFRTSR